MPYEITQGLDYFQLEPEFLFEQAWEFVPEELRPQFSGLDDCKKYIFWQND